MKCVATYTLIYECIKRIDMQRLLCLCMMPFECVQKILSAANDGCGFSRFETKQTRTNQ